VDAGPGIGSLITPQGGKARQPETYASHARRKATDRETMLADWTDLPKIRHQGKAGKIYRQPFRGLRPKVKQVWRFGRGTEAVHAGPDPVIERNDCGLSHGRLPSARHRWTHATAQWSRGGGSMILH
jgi:hypothetical protein